MWIGRVIPWLLLGSLLLVAVEGCKGRNPTASSGGGGGGGGGDAFCENCGYGITGGVADFREIAKYVRWTVIDLSHTVPDAAMVGAVRSARNAGLKVLFIPINLNCKLSGDCPADPIGLTRQVAASGTDGITLEVSEPSVADAALVDAILSAWPGQFAISEGPYMPPGPIDRHECNPDPNTWPSRPMHMTDCRDSLTQNARAIGEWTKARSGTVVILYDWKATTINRAVLAEVAGR